MRKLFALFCLTALISLSSAMAADDAADPDVLRQNGLNALRQSESNPRAVVEAAKNFANAAALYEKAQDEAKVTEMNSFLYWCKKKMTLGDIAEFQKNADTTHVALKLMSVEQAVPADQAPVYYSRVEKFAAERPEEHMSIAIRYFEVADRFSGTQVSLDAQRKSLEAMQSAMRQTPANSAAANTTIAQPKRDDSSAPSTASAPPTAKKPAIPDAAALKEAEKMVRDVYKSEFTRTTATDRQVFARKLVQEAEGSKKDLPAAYVLLREARDLAILAGDAATALQAIDGIAELFAIEPLDEKVAALTKLETNARTADAARTLAESMLKTAEDAIAVDSFDAAVKLAGRADSISHNASDAALLARAKDQLKAAQELQREAPAYRTAVASLKANPGDRTAATSAGKFLCFFKGDWDKGLNYLQIGADAALKTLAEKDLQKSEDPAALVSLGDNWFEVSSPLSGTPKIRVMTRARGYYAQAANTLTGIQKTKCDKRLAEIDVLLRKLGGTATAAAGTARLAGTLVVATTSRNDWGGPGGGPGGPGGRDRNRDRGNERERGFVLLNGKDLAKLTKSVENVPVSIREGDTITIKGVEGFRMAFKSTDSKWMASMKAADFKDGSGQAVESAEASSAGKVDKNLTGWVKKFLNNRWGETGLPDEASEWITTQEGNSYTIVIKQSMFRAWK